MPALMKSNFDRGMRPGRWAAAMTVTATQSGSTANGLSLKVLVITGHAGLGPNTGVQSANTGAAQAAINVSQTGSRIYGASMKGVNTSFTALGNTTYIDNIADATNACRYGTFRSTALTAATGSATYGSSAPTGSGGTNSAIVEVLPNGTITEDASSPAAVTVTGASTATTAVFQPPKGAMLLAFTKSNGGVAVVNSSTTGGGYTFSAVVEAHASGNDYAGIWVAYADDFEDWFTSGAANTTPAACTIQNSAANSAVNGSRYLNCKQTSSGTSDATHTPSGSPVSTYRRFRFYFTLRTAPSAQGQLIVCHSTSSNRQGIFMTTTATIQLRNVATGVGTASSALVVGTRYRFEWEIDCANSLQSLKVYAPDETTVFYNQTSVACSNLSWNQFKFGNQTASTLEYDIDSVVESDSSSEIGPEGYQTFGFAA